MTWFQELSRRGFTRRAGLKNVFALVFVAGHEF